MPREASVAAIVASIGVASKPCVPTLEKVTRAAGGRVKLVKIDIDKNQALVRQLAQMGLPLQSVPTVVAFWKGQIADLFQGALPESEVKRFVEALLKLAGGQMPTADLLGEAIVAAGFVCLEVPLNSPRPLQSIRRLRDALDGALLLAGLSA